MAGLYQTLGIRRNASIKTLDRAYAKRARETHPDRGGDADEFRSVQFAYEVLKDSGRRAHYDKTGETAFGRIGDARTASMQILTECFANTLLGLIQSARNPESEDVVKLMRVCLQAEKDALESNRKSVLRSRAAVEKTVARFETDDPDNLLAIIAKSQLVRIDVELQPTLTRIGLLADAMEALKKYRYRFEKPVFQPGTWRNGNQMPVTQLDWLLPSR